LSSIYFPAATLHAIVCKDACGTFGGNGVNRMLFVLAAADQLSVDLGALGETKWD
jgi:hypothetical protein